LKDEGRRDHTFTSAIPGPSSGVHFILLGAFGVYHQIMNALGRPKIGVRSLMEKLARHEFYRRVENAGLDGKFDLKGVDFKEGRVQLPTSLLPPPT
jgi:hypothetical protein